MKILRLRQSVTISGDSERRHKISSLDADLQALASIRYTDKTHDLRRPFYDALMRYELKFFLAYQNPGTH